MLTERRSGFSLTEFGRNVRLKPDLRLELLLCRGRTRPQGFFFSSSFLGAAGFLMYALFFMFSCICLIIGLNGLVSVDLNSTVVPPSRNPDPGAGVESPPQPEKAIARMTPKPIIAEQNRRMTQFSPGKNGSMRP